MDYGGFTGEPRGHYASFPDIRLAVDGESKFESINSTKTSDNYETINFSCSKQSDQEGE